MNLKKTYISATTGKQFSAPDLSPTSLHTYSQLMGRIQVAARDYDGSNYRRINFMTLAAKIAEMANGSSDLVDAYARQAHPQNNAVFSLDELFLNARARLRGSLDQESAFGVILKRFKDYDSKVVKQAKPITIEEQPAGKAVYQPRLAAIIDVLCEQYNGIENLKITTGPYVLPKDLRDTYVILSHKKTALKIAVCDDESMPTFISTTANSDEFWKEAGVKSVRAYDFNSYMDQVHKALRYTPQAQPDLHLLSGSVLSLPVGEEPEEDKPFKAKRNAQTAPETASAAAPRPEIDLLSQAASAWAAMPRVQSEPKAQSAAVAAEAPQAAAKPSSAQRAREDAHYDKLAADILSYVIQNRVWPTSNSGNQWPGQNTWLAHHQSSLPQAIANLVCGLADLHKNRTGEMPHRLSGPIPEVPGLTWAIIDDAYINKPRRTESLHLILNQSQPGHEERVAAERKLRLAQARQSSLTLQPAA
jgi:hypothetical protein